MKHAHALVTATCLAALIGCKNPAQPDKVYTPVFKSDTAAAGVMLKYGFPYLAYSETASELVKYLNANLNGIQVRGIPSTGYDEYIGKLEQRYFDFTFINGIEATKAQQNGYTVVARMVDDGMSSAVILVNRDSGVQKFSDLKGKTFAVQGKRFTPATMTALDYLLDHRVNAQKDLRLVYQQSFESAIMSASRGNTAAAAVLMRSWVNYKANHPEVTQVLEEKWTTPPIPNVAVIVRNDMPDSTKALLLSALLRAHKTTEGRKALDKIPVDSFVVADVSFYKSLTDLEKRFHSNFPTLDNQ